MPPDARFPKLFQKVRVRIGRPIDVTRYLDRADDRMVLRQIADEVMYEIRVLSGQEYVNEYATKKAEVLPSATGHIATEGQSADVDLDAETADDGANGDAAPRRSSADVLRARA